MKYTNEQQKIALENACKRANLDVHITTFYDKKDLITYADKVLWWAFRKNMPCKRSSMMCNAIDTDMTFCFTENGEPIYSHSGYVDDKNLDKIIQSFEKANELVKFMEEEIHKFDDTIDK